MELNSDQQVLRFSGMNLVQKKFLGKLSSFLKSFDQPFFYPKCGDIGWPSSGSGSVKFLKQALKQLNISDDSFLSKRVEKARNELFQAQRLLDQNPGDSELYTKEKL